MIAPELREDIETEMEQLRAVCFEVASLLHDTENRTGTIRECAAAGAFLSQFYNGIENTLKTILKYYGGKLPDGDNWHIQLLGLFDQANTAKMPGLLTPHLHSSLSLYRRYRHVVRNNYGHELRWDRLLPGLQEMEATLRDFKLTIDATLFQ